MAHERSEAGRAKRAGNPRMCHLRSGGSTRPRDEEYPEHRQAVRALSGCAGCRQNCRNSLPIQRLLNALLHGRKLHAHPRTIGAHAPNTGSALAIAARRAPPHDTATARQRTRHAVRIRGTSQGPRLGALDHRATMHVLRSTCGSGAAVAVRAGVALRAGHRLATVDVRPGCAGSSAAVVRRTAPVRWTRLGDAMPIARTLVVGSAARRGACRNACAHGRTTSGGWTRNTDPAAAAGVVRTRSHRRWIANGTNTRAGVWLFSA